MVWNANAYEDGSLEWRINRVRDNVGGNGKRSCAMAPTLQRVGCERSGVMVCGGSGKDLHSDLVRIATELGDVSLDPSQEELLW